MTSITLEVTTIVDDQEKFLREMREFIESKKHHDARVETQYHCNPSRRLLYSAEAASRFGSCPAVTEDGQIVHVTCTPASNDDDYGWEDKVYLGMGWRL